jgi:hypothetical protein
MSPLSWVKKACHQLGVKWTMSREVPENPHRVWLGGQVRGGGGRGGVKPAPIFFCLGGALLDLIGGFLE